MNGYRKIDLHMHSRVSDGTDTPEEILAHVKEIGLELFSLTDHDAVKGCKIIQEVRKEGDPCFITGAEFSCRDELGKYHILGYGYDPDKEPMQKLISTGHGFRMKKVRERLDFLKERFGFEFPEIEIKKILALDNPGKPHIGNLMVKLGYAESKEQAIKKFIDQVRFKNEYVRPEQAIEGILGGGGIPVLAHPFYGSGEELILGDEMDERLQRLMGFGLKGVEVFYSGFTPRLRKNMLEFAEKYDLYVTCGSDYHGSNKMIELGDTGFTEETPVPEGLRRFLEDVRF